MHMFIIAVLATPELWELKWDLFHFQRSNHLFTFRPLNKLAEGTRQCLHLQTEDRWLTTLSSLLQFGLAQRR